MSNAAVEVEMVDVEITAEERVRYHTYTKMPKAKYELYLKMVDDNERDSKFAYEFSDYIKFDMGEFGNDITDLEIELRT